MTPVTVCIPWQISVLSVREVFWNALVHLSLSLALSHGGLFDVSRSVLPGRPRWPMLTQHSHHLTKAESQKHQGQTHGHDSPCYFSVRFSSFFSFCKWDSCTSVVLTRWPSWTTDLTVPVWLDVLKVCPCLWDSQRMPTPNVQLVWYNLETQFSLSLRSRL